MRSRHSKVPVFLALVCCLVLHYVNGGAGPPFQGNRAFGNLCDGCVVSKGVGFQSYNPDCTCFYICELVMSPKLSSMASEYVSHKKCCGCGQTFSKKLITCVNYYDKRSDCFSANPGGFNPCVGTPGINISREKEESIAGDRSNFCSGFSACILVGDESVPEPRCCEDGLCYDPVNEICTAPACDTSPACADLLDDEKDDCECEITEAPESECQFMPVTGNVTVFMGVEEMISYNCPAGTCWDQDSCTCVVANNTGYNDCNEFVDMEFNEDLNATDSLGNIIYTTVHGSVSIVNEAARFTNAPGQLNLVGTANTWLSNTLVFHFEFVLEEDDTSSFDQNQCIVGNCKIVENPVEPDTFRIAIERGENGDGENIDVFLTYQERIFMNLQNSMEERNLELEGDFEINVAYDFWLIYCGSEEVVYAGVLEGTEVRASAVAEVEGSVQLIGSQTGFLLGDCRNRADYEGTLDEVEIYRNCKPFDDDDFDEAFVRILADL